MPAWSYNVVHYRPRDGKWWQGNGFEQDAGKDPNPGLQKICEEMGKAQWDLATVIQEGDDYRLFFKRP